jgi:hypothetical protein
MTRPTFLEGVGVALLASLGAGAAYAGLGLFFPVGLALRLVIAGLSLGYLLYLLGRSRERVGRISLLLLWGLMAAGSWLLGLSLPLYVLAHLGLVWLVRVLYHQSGFLAALLDLGLAALGLGAALWAAGHSGSLFLACWSFFLVQALFTAIPVRFGGGPAPANPADDRFEQAHRAAEAALRSLATQQH